MPTTVFKTTDRERLLMLRGELTKLRCWHTGYEDGRHVPGSLPTSVPGSNVLRMLIVEIDDALTEK